MKFNAIELDLIIRGLFALQQMQPIEAAEIQRLIDKIASTEFEVE